MWNAMLTSFSGYARTGTHKGIYESFLTLTSRSSSSFSSTKHTGDGFLESQNTTKSCKYVDLFIKKRNENRTYTQKKKKLHLILHSSGQRILQYGLVKKKKK